MRNVILFNDRNSGVALDPNIALHALDQTASAIIFLDEDKQIIFFNEAAATLLDRNPADVLRRPVSEVFPTVVCTEFDQYLEKFKQSVHDLSPGTFSRDFEIVKKDKILFWANASFSRVKYEDKTYFTILIRDVTKRRHVEDELASKNEQIVKLTAQMEKFLYSTSHDLRSPLTSILGLVNLMRIESHGDSFQEYTDKIEASAMRLDGIIRNIMNFSKATYQRRRSQKIDLEVLAHRILNAHSDVNHKNIFFEVVVSNQLPFFSDPERLEIILNNLVSNAIRFFDPNKVRSFVRVNVVVTAVDVSIEVIDNGLGIGHQHHEHIFSMFYKATLNSSGAGLGLYIVKESLEQLKGSVTMESELGFGSVFRIRIPNDHKGQLMNRKLQLRHF